MKKNGSPDLMGFFLGSLIVKLIYFYIVFGIRFILKLYFPNLLKQDVNYSFANYQTQ